MPDRRRFRTVAPELRKFCTKMRYDNQHSAERALQQAREDHSRDPRRKLEKRAYLHDGPGGCGKWHLTSMAEIPKQRPR